MEEVNYTNGRLKGSKGLYTRQHDTLSRIPTINLNFYRFTEHALNADLVSHNENMDTFLQSRRNLNKTNRKPNFDLSKKGTEHISIQFSDFVGEILV